MARISFALVVAVLSLLCGGCALTSDQAVIIATRELQRGDHRLPAQYVTVVHSARTHEAGVDYWDVTFMTPDYKKELYGVLVNQYSHTVEDEDVVDYSKLVPGELYSRSHAP